MTPTATTTTVTTTTATTTTTPTTATKDSKQASPMSRPCQRVLARRRSSYCLVSMVLVSLCSYAEAHSVSSKHSIRGDNNMVISQQPYAVNKFLDGRTAASAPRSKQSKSLAINGKSSYNFEATTELIDDSVASNGDSTGPFNRARKGSKGAKWWSQIDTTSTVDDEPAKNTKISPREPDSPDSAAGTSGNKSEAKPLASKIDNSKPTAMSKALASVDSLNYQWATIKQKQRTLATVSMPELRLLDGKLIKTYRQCQKRRLYFFGGMLYRTRDFVVKLYRDAKSERKFLEAVAKQVDANMKQLMTDYNISPTISNADMVKMTSVTDDNKQQILQNDTSNSDSDKQQQVNSGKSDANSINNGDNKSINRVGAKQESYIYSSSKTAELVAGKSALSGKMDTKWKHISDIRMRRRLDHAQSLIDRIHRSSTELSSIVDDIIFVFRLDGNRNNRDKVLFGQQQQQQQQSSDNSSRSRRKSSTFKSPIKVFMERYGNIFQAPKQTKQDLRLANYSRVSQPLIEKDCTNSSSSSEATSLCHLDPLDVITMSQDSTTANSSSTSSSLTLNSSGSNTGAVDTGDPTNVSGALEEDAGLAETSTILTLVDGINTNTTVYHLDNSSTSN